jgi:hypothetical protein
MYNEEYFISTEEDNEPSSETEQEPEIAFAGWTKNDQSLSSVTANLVSQLGIEAKYLTFISCLNDNRLT